MAQPIADSASATPVAPPYGTRITHAQAQAAMHAAEAEALAQGWAVAIAIVDSSARLVMMHKLDGTQHSSVEVAIAKARTAVDFRKPTKHYEDAVAAGGGGLRFLGMPGLVPLEGGFPIIVEGAIIGGIGVSGVRSDLDARIATAGMRVLVQAEPR